MERGIRGKKNLMLPCGIRGRGYYRADEGVGSSLNREEERASILRQKKVSAECVSYAKTTIPGGGCGKKRGR